MDKKMNGDLHVYLGTGLESSTTGDMQSRKKTTQLLTVLMYLTG